MDCADDVQTVVETGRGKVIGLHATYDKKRAARLKQPLLLKTKNP